MDICRVDNIPLMKYLFDGNTSQHSEAIFFNSSDELLSTMSGQNSLGIGFQIFVKSNFNQSQLEAITVATCKYNDRGFILIKGPPCTGKCIYIFETTKINMLVVLLNDLCLRQYQQYYNAIEQIIMDKSEESTIGLSSIRLAMEIISFNATAKVNHESLSVNHPMLPSTMSC
eukprot:11292467-Ditylum_brightwellii.AAC.2